MKAIFTLVLIMCFNVFATAQTNQTAHEYPESIPTFQFAKIKGEGIFESKDIKKNKQTLIALVSPECIHCLLSIEHLNNNFNYLKDVNVILVTEYGRDEFKSKVGTIGTHFFESKNVEILQDTEYEFMEKFKPLSIPTFYLYDKNNKLVTVKRGSVEINQIFQDLK